MNHISFQSPSSGNLVFDLPSARPNIIKVIGVGGAGGNAVNHMFQTGIHEVDFLLCNTDYQALERSQVSMRLQLGPNLTAGRGAGNRPEVGREAAIETLDDLRAHLGEDTRMVFITAGLGGGTGTGAAPVIARLCRELDILTVGIVTLPFSFEGKKRLNQAAEGLEQLREHCDTTLVISNDKVREVYGNLAFDQAFARADDVLATAAKGIAEIITIEGHVNVDFSDVNTVLRNSGKAVMGSGLGRGEDRAIAAIKGALSSPLLSDNDINGASSILLNISSGE
ncbi:MAG: cell division protein FtsZ, partial [Bacteroidota bacterium]